MIDDEDVLPLDGGEVPDDQVLKARLETAYRNLPLAEQGAVARCVRMVLERVTGEHAVPLVATGKFRRWIIGAGAVAAAVWASNKAGAAKIIKAASTDFISVLENKVGQIYGDEK